MSATRCPYASPVARRLVDLVNQTTGSSAARARTMASVTELVTIGPGLGRTGRTQWDWTDSGAGILGLGGTRRYWADGCQVAHNPTSQARGCWGGVSWRSRSETPAVRAVRGRPVVQENWASISFMSKYSRQSTIFPGSSNSNTPTMWASTSRPAIWTVSIRSVNTTFPTVATLTS